MIRLAESDDFAEVFDVMVHPSVRPFVGLDCSDDMYLETFVRAYDSFVWIMVGKPAVGVFQLERIAKDEDDWMVHVAAIPEGRGRVMIEAAREVVDLLAGMGAKTLYAWTSKGNYPSRWFAGQCGMRASESAPVFRPGVYDSTGLWYTMNIPEVEHAGRR